MDWQLVVWFGGEGGFGHRTSPPTFEESLWQARALKPAHSQGFVAGDVGMLGCWDGLVRQVKLLFFFFLCVFCFCVCVCVFVVSFFVCLCLCFFPFLFFVFLSGVVWCLVFLSGLFFGVCLEWPEGLGFWEPGSIQLARARRWMLAGQPQLWSSGHLQKVPPHPFHSRNLTFRTRSLKKKNKALNRTFVSGLVLRGRVFLFL